MQRKTVLIVEDDRPLMQALYEKLNREDIDVYKAYDGDEGLAMALAKHPDLLLVDIVMPKMNGLVMLKKLHEDDWGSQARVMVLTNLAEDMHLDEDLKKHIVGYFIKSEWRLEAIIREVKKHL